MNKENLLFINDYKLLLNKENKTNKEKYLFNK